MYSIIKYYLRHILAVCVVSLCVMTGTAASSVKLDVDWPQFMSKQDMVWETLPEYWYESAYMGNGMLGLMIYKEPGQNYIRLETGNCAVVSAFHKSTRIFPSKISPFGCKAKCPVSRRPMLNKSFLPFRWSCTAQFPVSNRI